MLDDLWSGRAQAHAAGDETRVAKPASDFFSKPFKKSFARLPPLEETQHRARAEEAALGRLRPSVTGPGRS